MPPVRTGRASKACTLCRSGKTRCYPSSTSASCLRCHTLQIPCSLANERIASRPGAVPSISTSSHKCEALEQRVILLEAAVQGLSEKVGIEHNTDGPAQRSLVTPLTNGTIQHRTSAPLQVIKDAASVQPTESASESRPSVFDKRILSRQEAILLLVLFQRHYGRWIGLDEDGPSITLDQIPSDLLLCACCLVAVRHDESHTTPTKAAALFAEAKALLAVELLISPQDHHFFYATIIMSMWSTTAGRKPVSIDSWLTTSFSIQHKSLVSDNESTSSPPDPVLVHLRLAHLHACVSMRRQAVFDRRVVDETRYAVRGKDLPNFAVRMVAELHLYWTIYEGCVASPGNLARAQAALNAWKDEWSFLFDQTRHQFLQMGSLFAQLLMYEQSLTNRSTTVRESFIFEMVKLSCDIIKLAQDTTDDRTAFLTDHIYHMITFAAVTLNRLLSYYEERLSTTYDIDALDTMLLDVAYWLHSIGQPWHIGKMMGDAISSAHRTKRPEAYTRLSEARSISSFGQETPGDVIFPGFLGFDNLIAWDSILSEE